MFKHATLYRTGLHAISLDILEHELQRNPFNFCLATQQLSVGWVPPREANGAMVESIDGWRIMALEIETKRVPAATIQKRVADQAVKIEKIEGRKPGKKRIKELKEEALLDLLPNAFPKRVRVNVAVDETGLTIVGATAGSALENVIKAIVTAMVDVQVAPINTSTAPATLMADLLRGESVCGSMYAGSACELKSTDETKATVRYAHHALDIEEIYNHLDGGKTVTKLEISGDRISFILTDALQLKSIHIDDEVAIDDNERDDSFSANAFLTLNTLGPAIRDLIEAMGGAVKAEQQA